MCTSCLWEGLALGSWWWRILVLTNSLWGVVMVNWQWGCAGKVRNIQGEGICLEGWWHLSCLTHWTHRSCVTSVDVARCLPSVHVGWMTTELLKLHLLEKHPGIVLLPPPSALLSNTPYPLSSFFSLPQISTCFSAMLPKPLTALLLLVPPLWKVSWNLSHWCFDQAWGTSLMLFWICFTWGKRKNFQNSKHLTNSYITLVTSVLVRSLPVMQACCRNTVSEFKISRRVDDMWGSIDGCIHLYLFYKIFFLRQHFR